MFKLLSLTLFVLAMIALPVKAEDWYNITGISKHTNTDTEHNERNWGLGYETELCGFTKTPEWWCRNWQIGAYRNSFWKPTTYLTTELTSYHFSDTLRYRLNGGLVTGYRYPATPMVLPVLTYATAHWGMDVLTIPSIMGRQGIYALQLKVRF